jgi:hypothetical protein
LVEGFGSRGSARREYTFTTNCRVNCYNPRMVAPVETGGAVEDVREQLVELLVDLNRVVRCRGIPSEQLRIITDRAASLIVTTGAPAALAVKAAVEKEPGRFRASGRIAAGAGVDVGGEGEREAPIRVVRMMRG